MKKKYRIILWVVVLNLEKLLFIFFCFVFLVFLFEVDLILCNIYFVGYFIFYWINCGILFKVEYKLRWCMLLDWERLKLIE